jgi:protein involved in polysaccharide export with SLBB domain
MKKGSLSCPLILIGLLIAIAPVTSAQPSNADSSAVSPEEDCQIPVTIFGKVASPKNFELQHQTRLSELIAFAGGVIKPSKGDIQILHTAPNTICESLAPSKNTSAIDVDNPKTYIETYKLSDVMRGNKQANPYLRPGDVVSIGLVKHISIIGNVKNPHQIDFKKNLTVLRAITLAGGLLPDARKEKIYVHRYTQTGWTVLVINPKTTDKHREEDIILQPNDIVEVLSQKESAEPSIFPTCTFP